MSHVCDGHDVSCPSCIAMAKRNATVRTAMTVDDQLDDIKRVHIWSRIADQLAVPAPRRARWPAIAALAAVAAVAAVFVVARGRDGEAPVMTVAADTTLTSRLGPHTHAALVGPAQLEIVGTPGDATTVRLRSGTLLAEFAGGSGRSLRIEAGDTVIEVIGTLFAVEVRATVTCVSVSHGKVRVTRATSVIVVTDHQHVCSGEVEPRVIPRAINAALERHQVVITARVDAPVENPPTIVPPVASIALPTPPVSGIAPTPTPTPPTPTPSVTVRTSAARPDESRLPQVASIPAVQTRAPIDAVAPPIQPAVRSPEIARSPSTVVPATTPAATPPASIDSSPRSSTREPAEDSSPSPPATVTPTPAKPTADELYRAAERALAARDHAAADRALETLLADYPTSSLVDQALYERARMAYQHRAWATARRHLDRLAAIPRTPLAEPGHYLTCRIAIEARDGEAEKCVVDYRKTYPRSPHDVDLLSILVQLAHTSGGCGTAAPLVDELVRTYPRASNASAWRARCPMTP